MDITKIFILVALAFAVDALKWDNCDDDTPVQVTRLNVSPRTVRLRQRVSITGKFKVSGNAGSRYRLTLTLKRNGRRVSCREVPCTYNIGCNDAAGLLGGIRCPLRSGNFNFRRQTINLAASPLSALKKGKYEIKADLKAGKKRIACLEAEEELR